MQLSENEEKLYSETNTVLEALYDYLQSDIAEQDITTTLLNKMTGAVKATIRYNNVLAEAIKEKIIFLDEKTVNLLNKFYGFYEMLPKKSEDVITLQGAGSMEIYTGMIQSMTPVALFINSFLDCKAESEN